MGGGRCGDVKRSAAWRWYVSSTQFLLPERLRSGILSMSSQPRSSRSSTPRWPPGHSEARMCGGGLFLEYESGSRVCDAASAGKKEAPSFVPDTALLRISGVVHSHSLSSFRTSN